MIQRLHSLRKNKLATLRSVKKLDNNICLLDYRNEYHLPELLNKGVSSIGELTAFAANALTLGLRLFKPGTDQGAGCTTFEAYTAEGNHLLARNFDFKTAPCFVVWTHPDRGYASVSVVDTNFMAYGNALRLHRFNRYRALLAPYCCVDGMNEKGLVIAVSQLRAKATNQKEPGKKDITTDGNNGINEPNNCPYDDDKKFYERYMVIYSFNDHNWPRSQKERPDISRTARHRSVHYGNSSTFRQLWARMPKTPSWIQQRAAGRQLTKSARSLCFFRTFFFSLLIDAVISKLVTGPPYG